MVGVHSQSDLGLPAIAAEVPLAHQKPDEEAGLEAGSGGRPLARSCFTVKSHLEHPGCFTVKYHVEQGPVNNAAGDLRG